MGMVAVAALSTLALAGCSSGGSSPGSSGGSSGGATTAAKKTACVILPDTESSPAGRAATAPH